MSDDTKIAAAVGEKPANEEMLAAEPQQISDETKITAKDACPSNSGNPTTGEDSAAANVTTIESIDNATDLLPITIHESNVQSSESAPSISSLERPLIVENLSENTLLEMHVDDTTAATCPAITPQPSIDSENEIGEKIVEQSMEVVLKENENTCAAETNDTEPVTAIGQDTCLDKQEIKIDKNATECLAEVVAEEQATVNSGEAKAQELEADMGQLKSNESSINICTAAVIDNTHTPVHTETQALAASTAEILAPSENLETEKAVEIKKDTAINANESASLAETKAEDSDDVEVVENLKKDEVIMLLDSSEDEEDQQLINASNIVETVMTTEQPETEKNISGDPSADTDMAIADTNDLHNVVPTAMDVEEAEPSNAQQEEAALPHTAMETEDTLLSVCSSPKPTSPEAAPTEPIADEIACNEIFYNKECISYECLKQHKQFLRATGLVLSHYKIAAKRNKPQYVCFDCYDKALEIYENCSGMLMSKQPILFMDVADGRPEFVEIIDSSDDEDETGGEERTQETNEFSTKDLMLISNELENTMKSVFDKVDIQNQLTWSLTMLQTRLKHSVDEIKIIDNDLRDLQRKTGKMFDSLYQCQKVKIAELPPIDLNTGQTYAPSDSQLKPIGEIVRQPIEINECYYAVKNKPLASWVPCKVTEQVDMTTGPLRGLPHYKVRFLGSQYPVVKTVPIKHMAYFEPPAVRLSIGTRVIAYFDASTLTTGKEKALVQSAFYPGIIAEPLKGTNKFRYLIFYDDGYTQYVNHRDVRLVCHAAEKVWEDVHAGSRDFIEKYVTQYNINRPMVQTHKGQSMSTESNGVWLYARVVDIDCSLVKMQFDGPKAHTEWIYRGSLRLSPVFREYHKMQKLDIPQSRLPRRTEPFIRYTEDEEATSNQTPERMSATETPQRAVARKSVSRLDTQQPQQVQPAQAAQVAASANTSNSSTPAVKHLNNSTIYVEDESVPKGKVVYYTAKRNLPPRKYRFHNCDKNCLFTIQHNLSTYSPLSKPLLSGWERMIMRQKIKKVCVYRAPCGKMLRNMQEIRDYLRATENVLNVDNFDFTPETCCLAEYVIESSIIHKRDIANGLEKMALPLVNYYDNTLPPECVYAAQRIPTEGVHLNLDEEFLVGCDCEDDCLDKSKCSCWQLTLAGAKYGNPNVPPEDVGYQFKRLYEHVPTGIYECNSRCKCKSNCLNRVVQHSLQMKLQVFKTNNRGWGLRCINDIPRGSFICIYAGYLLTESKANEGGVDAGDEYFAELDYIEVAEQVKEGYESDVEPPEPEEEDDDEELYRGDDDADFRPGKAALPRSKSRDKPTRQRDSVNGDNDSQERQVINFNPNADLDETTQRESSIRRLFGKDEACYVMDAKTIGNLGRYFNHSCSPNLFVQNVFVDTHDLRFPWVAFFASTHIRAGTELTWNYNYEVGVVPGKVLYCQCGAPNCRQRLL